MSSSPEKLVHMANQIGKFFQSQGPDRAVSGTAEHIRKFWDPHMRRKFLDLADHAELHPLVRKAVPLIS